SHLSQGSPSRAAGDVREDTDNEVTALDDYAKAQLQLLVDNEASEGSRIRVMPDVHPGKLFLAYPKVQTLSELLRWSHYVELLKIDDELERAFYEK
ncbi:MAG: hypothetical protein J6N99_08220, partial [Schwartzia sp.]|nr:hypothetical protein [Schwartzia sp. (in: firmicutes)]